MTTLLRRFCADESGTTTIEYGLMLAVLSLLVIGAVGGFAGRMEEAFKTLASTISTATI